MKGMLLRKLHQATLIGTAGALIAVGLTGVAGASAQQAPSGNKGLKTSKMQTLDLGPEIERLHLACLQALIPGRRLLSTCPGNAGEPHRDQRPSRADQRCLVQLAQ